MMKLAAVIVCLHGVIASERYDKRSSSVREQNLTSPHSQVKYSPNRTSNNKLLINSFPEPEEDFNDEISKENGQTFQELIIPSSEQDTNNITFSSKIEIDKKASIQEQRVQFVISFTLGVNLAHDYCNYIGLTCQHWQYVARYFKSDDGTCYVRQACGTEGSSSNYQCEKNCL